MSDKNIQPNWRTVRRLYRFAKGFLRLVLLILEVLKKITDLVP